LDISKPSNIIYKLPNIWPAYILSVSAMLIEFIPEHLEYPFHLFYIYISLLLIGVIYNYVCIYKIHKFLEKTTNHSYSIKPGSAVFFHCVPIYNFYWIYKWTTKLEKFINKNLSDSELKEGGSLAYIFLGIAFYSFNKEGFGLALMLVGVDRLNRGLRKAFKS